MKKLKLILIKIRLTYEFWRKLEYPQIWFNNDYRTQSVMKQFKDQQ